MRSKTKRRQRILVPGNFVAKTDTIFNGLYEFLVLYKLKLRSKTLNVLNFSVN